MLWVINHSKQRGNARLVLLMIANHADNYGEHAFAGHDTLAREAACDPRQVFRIIPRLLASGELIITRQGGPGKGNTHEYALPLVRQDGYAQPPKGGEMSPFPGSKRWPKSGQNLTSAPPKGGQNLAKTWPHATLSVPESALNVNGINVNPNNESLSFFSKENEPSVPGPSPSSASPPPHTTTMHSCAYPGCAVSTYHLYCMEHGDMATGLQTLKPKYQPKEVEP